MLRNVVTDLIIHGHVKVTEAVSKDVVKEAARLVTLTKKADVMNAKRAASAFVRNVKAENGQSAVDYLFAEIGPKFVKRDGGYTRTLKLGNRKGDDAPIVLVAWVEE